MSQTFAQLINGKSATVEFSSGSASTPAVSFSGDTNTGIYSPGADQVAISTNGTGRLFVDASGNVGIGNSSQTSYNSAADNLVIGSTGSNGITIVSGSTNAGYIMFADGTVGQQAYEGQITYDHTNNYFAFNTSATERMRLDSSGRLGLGSSTPGSLLEIKSANQNPNICRLYNAYNAGATSWGVDFYRDTDDGNNLAVAEIKAVRTGGNPSELKFGTSTTPGTVVERMRIDSSGRIGIGTTAPNRKLEVSDASADNLIRVNTTGATKSGIEFASGGTVYSQLYFNNVAPYDLSILQQYTTGSLILGTNNTERARIDSSGRLLVGTSSARSNFFRPFSATAAVQIEGTSGNLSTLSVVRNSNDSSPSYFVLGKSRGTANASNTIVQSGDAIGGISFQGTDGGDLTEAARISAEVDGTPGVADLPGRLVFSTTADGASSPTEAMRITSSQEVLIGGTVDIGPYALQVKSTGVWGAGAYVNGSDRSIKEDIEPLASSIEIVKRLNPVSFRYKEDFTKDTALQPGFVAQDLQQAFAGQPYLDGIVQAGPEFLSVAYQSLIPVLTKALQEAVAKIETLEAEVAALKGA